MLLGFQLIAAISIVFAAWTGRGSRDSYFGGTIAAILIGFAFLTNLSTPAQLMTLSESERIGAERLNALAPPIAWLFFAVAIGAAIGACVFRAPRVATEREEVHDLRR